MNKTTPPSNSATGSFSGKSCSTGSCGGPGLCPGVALFLAYAVGGGIVLLTGLTWLGWVVGVPVALILLTGAWRWLPGRWVAPVKPDSLESNHES